MSPPPPPFIFYDGPWRAREKPHIFPSTGAEKASSANLSKLARQAVQKVWDSTNFECAACDVSPPAPPEG